MKADGSVAAVEICNLEAQAITYGISEAQTGWEIARTSHKLRNPANAPDAYETAVLEDFLARAATGEAPDTMVRAEIITENDQKMFRMTRAIPTGQPCAACHGGDEVAPEAEAILSEYYPDDAARNFIVGDIRGICTLTKELE